MHDPADLRTARISSHLGTDLITAECLQPGCGWLAHFTPGGQYLGKIVEVCSEHPCRLKAEATAM